MIFPEKNSVYNLVGPLKTLKNPMDQPTWPASKFILDPHLARLSSWISVRICSQALSNLQGDIPIGRGSWKRLEKNLMSSWETPKTPSVHPVAAKKKSEMCFQWCWRQSSRKKSIRPWDLWKKRYFPYEPSTSKSFCQEFALLSHSRF